MQNNKMSNSQAKYWAIVPAAGTSTRMQNDIPKQYLELAGKAVITHTLERLIKTGIFTKIIVLLHPEDNNFKNLKLTQNNNIISTIGGEQRYHSVFNGLNIIRQRPEYTDADWVLVHDAARPCITVTDINLLVNKLNSEAVGGILGYPVTDTIKKVAKGSILETTERFDLWHALTPQMFKATILFTALANTIENNIPITDDAAAVEALGYKPKIVAGRKDNIKITSDADIALAKYYLQQQNGA